MSLQSQAPLAFEFRRYLGYPACPRCGEQLVTADASAFLENGHVQHSWACESCGEEFKTSVDVTEAPGVSPA